MAPPAAPGEAPAGRHTHLVAPVVGVVGALVVAALVWLTGAVNAHTQAHLLHTQTETAGLVLGEVVPSITSPLDTALAAAEVSGGDPKVVEPYVAPDVGTGHGRLFVSLSLWRLSPAGPVPVLRLGAPTTMGSDPAAVAAVMSGVPRPGVLDVVDRLDRTPPRLGYAMEGPGGAARYAILAESALPPHRRAVVPPSSAFHDLSFALYLGRPAHGGDLLEATTPPPSRAASSSVREPFGTSSLVFVASARRPLGGGLLPVLPWIIGAVGAVIVAAAVVMAEWLVRRRRTAERLARENLRLYAEQRSISETLQHALLPKALPDVAGMAFAARYVPGDSTADIGGDWYDVIRCDERSFIFTVGDVSGRGVPAASTMASLHYAIRAYAAQGDDAGTILEKLAALLDVARDGHFATVLLGHVDVPAHRLTVVSAGHPPPLVVSGETTHFVEVEPGAPVGVGGPVRCAARSVEVAAGASVLAYTDGLVERRGEYLDTGLRRLQEAAGSGTGDPEVLLDRVVGALVGDQGSDDVALLAMQWKE